MATGVHAIIQSPGRLPYMKAAIGVAPGMETTINLHQAITRRLPVPYGACTSQTKLNDDQVENWTR